jgi:excisionase family DNA binding protein
MEEHMNKYQIGNKNLFTNYPDIISIKELMQMLGIGKNLAYELIKTKQIKHKKVGREIKIQKRAVITFINGGLND